VSDEKKETDPVAEVKAMGKLTEAVADLDEEAVGRVIRWAAERYNVTLGGGGARRKPGSPAGTGDAGDTGENGNGVTQKFGELADLYAATSPETDADKTLVAGYWFQFGEGRADFGAQELNSALKNLGHPIRNITSAFDTLKARKPAPVMQLKKSGTTKQARKTYKLTVAGKNAVELMIGPH
jgi:hypothetical protein